MKVGAFIRKLSNTTLRNLGVTEGITQRTLNEEYREEIIEYINSGLLELFNKYQLKVDYIYLELQEGKTRYELTSEHDMANWHEPAREMYIWKDSIESFKDDLVKVLLIRDSYGYEIPLNDPNEVISVYTPEYNVLEVSAHLPAQVITVDYQAKHPVVSSDDDEIRLPDSLYDVLAYYVAMQACSNMNGESSIANATKYAQLYNNAIENFDTLGTFEPKHTATTKKFYMRGWY